MTSIREDRGEEGGRRLLLLDTCGSEATVALAEGERVLEQRIFSGRRASEELIGVIADLLPQQGWRLRDLDALVVVRGPGSFTGVRVGLSAAKGLVEVSSLALLAVSRLEVLAGRVPRDTGRAPQDVVAMLEAGRGEVFWAQVRAGRTVEQGVSERGWVVEHARALGLGMVCEEGSAGELSGVAVLEAPRITAADAVPLALARAAKGEIADPLLLDALYLHKTEQETIERQRRHRAARVTEAGV